MRDMAGLTMESRGLWGIVLLCMAAANDFPGLMAARFFLGVLESGVSPCFVLLTAMYYKRYVACFFQAMVNNTDPCTRSEQPLRTAMWFSMNGMSQIIGGPIAVSTPPQTQQRG